MVRRSVFYGGKLMLTGGKLIDGKAIMCDLLLWDPEGAAHKS